MKVRAFFRAAKVESAKPPYDTIHMKIFYPTKGETDNNQDIPPADPQQAPYSVVIFFNGWKCGPQTYQWLAMKLVERGLVVVTFSWIEEYSPGKITLTPGINSALWKPETYGTGPSSSTLPTLLQELERLQSTEPLAGMLDLQRIILGGHSAGGRMAMENADPRFFAQVAGAFAYGTSAAAPVSLGHEPGKILPLPDKLPLLLMGGTSDAIAARMAKKYGLGFDPLILLEYTFCQAISGGREDSYLLILEGAKHFTISHPFDLTQVWISDLPPTQSEDKIRDLMAETIGLFIDAHVRQQPTALRALNSLLDPANPLIASVERK